MTLSGVTMSVALLWWRHTYALYLFYYFDYPILGRLDLTLSDQMTKFMSLQFLIEEVMLLRSYTDHIRELHM